MKIDADGVLYYSPSSFDELGLKRSGNLSYNDFWTLVKRSSGRKQVRIYNHFIDNPGRIHFFEFQQFDDVYARYNCSLPREEYNVLSEEERCSYFEKVSGEFSCGESVPFSCFYIKNVNILISGVRLVIKLFLLIWVMFLSLIIWIIVSAFICPSGLRL